MPFVIFLAAPGMDQLKGLYENSRYSSRNLAVAYLFLLICCSFRCLVSMFYVWCTPFFCFSLTVPVRSVLVPGELGPSNLWHPYMRSCDVSVLSFNSCKILHDSSLCFLIRTEFALTGSFYWHGRRRTSKTPWRKVPAFRGHTKSILIKLSSTKTPTPRSAKWSNLWRSCLISINGFPSLGSTKKKRKIIRMNLIHLPSELKSESHLSFASPSSDKHLRRAKFFVGKTEKLAFFLHSNRISVAVIWSVVLNNVDDQSEPFQTKYSSFYYKYHWQTKFYS